MKMRLVRKQVVRTWRDDMHDRAKLRHRIYFAKLKRYGEVLCFCCGRQVAYEEATLEHILPLSLGGHPTHPSNLDISHGPCNSKRGNLRGVYRRIGKLRRVK